MLDESVSTINSSIWTSMNSWFTPTVLFVLLNVMIATIAFTSSLANDQKRSQNHPKHEEHQQQQEDYSQQHQQQQEKSKIIRSPSILQRIKSINFYNYRSQEPVKNYNFDLPRQQEPTFEPQIHYIFDHEHSNIETDSTHYNFNQENAQKTQTQYHFQEQKLENMDQDFNFQQTHEQNLENINQDFSFHQSHQQKLQEKSTHFIFQQPHEGTTENMNTHFDLQQPHEVEENDHTDGELKSLDEVYRSLRERHVNRSRSDTKPSAGEPPAKLPANMKKSASMKSPFSHFEEEDIVETRRPATTREKVTKSDDGDNEVDAKANDFINKFKQQLKIQRLDSILRYKEMIGRGS